jgi:protein-S-isoprenylcysteine O-methyltransferase Ste14
MLQRILGVVLGIAFLVAVFFFAAVAAGIVLAAGLLAWAWAGWRGRGRVRRTDAQNVVIEGEYRRL